ncbi:FAD-containing oxidoreductase [Sphingomonas abietis]|nr:FAD-containing oxidoreductase [Sphingomonas abietis]
MRRFDAIIVGAGQAGPALAGRLNDAGKTVALVERHLVGGTCVNTGCKPTKTLVASAYAAHLARRAADYGVTIAGGIGIDMPAVFARVQKVVRDSRHGNEAWLEGMEHVTLIRGHARFTGPDRIRVGDERDGEDITAPLIFLNVGGRASIPDFPGVDAIDPLTNSSILQLQAVPRHLIVVGGSYIGLEFAQSFRRLGAQVTVIEKGPRIIAREDEDVSAAIHDILEKEGIAFRLDAECIAFAPHPDGVACGVSCANGEPQVIGSHVLIAVGRRPNTDDLGLDAAGIETDERGYIQVDDKLATNVPGIWAMGDCNGRGAFTHTAYNDFEIVAENMLDGADRKVTDRVPCYGLFVDPPLGRCGMSEAEARAKGHRIKVGQRAMSRVGRAVEKGEALGLMKIVVDADSDRILGGAILGPGGDEAIHSILDMMQLGATAATLRRTVHIHPTVAELIPTIAGEIKG